MGNILALSALVPSEMKNTLNLPVWRDALMLKASLYFLELTSTGGSSSALSILSRLARWRQ